MIKYLKTRDFIKAIEVLRRGQVLDSRWYVPIHPKIWNGYWNVRRTIPFFRWLGRKLHNKYIYWLGFQVEWMEGLKDIIEKDKENAE